ncbi:MAG: nitrilase-related carbon-nitrogen hydrolase, partial [Pseudomonadota bacterium]
MKIILAQPNPVVGDIEANCAAIRSLLLEARDNKTGLVVFPELAVTGYPPRDLLERKGFAERSAAAVRELAGVCTGELRALVGFVEPNDGQEGKPYFNAAALLGGGRIMSTYRKMLLPSYDVFDETRWFEPGDGPTVFEAGGHSFAVTICEDLW